MPFRSRPGPPRQVLANLMVHMPLGRKLRLSAENLLNRFRHRDLCCGHPGQPGC